MYASVTSQCHVITSSPAAEALSLHRSRLRQERHLRRGITHWSRHAPRQRSAVAVHLTNKRLEQLQSSYITNHADASKSASRSRSSGPENRENLIRRQAVAVLNLYEHVTGCPVTVIHNVENKELNPFNDTEVNLESKSTTDPDIGELFCWTRSEDVTYTIAEMTTPTIDPKQNILCAAFTVAFKVDHSINLAGFPNTLSELNPCPLKPQITTSDISLILSFADSWTTPVQPPGIIKKARYGWFSGGSPVLQSTIGFRHPSITHPHATFTCLCETDEMYNDTSWAEAFQESNNKKEKRKAKRNTDILRLQKKKVLYI